MEKMLDPVIDIPEGLSMALYISFPVGLFYFFNQPSFFEDWMMEKRAKIFPPQDPKAKEIIEAYLEKSEIKKEKEMIAAFQAAREKKNL